MRWQSAALAGLLIAGAAAAQSYSWQLPTGFPIPFVPADNPMTAAKVKLGRYLFYDERMSVNGQFSCSTCHKQELAFTDGKPVSIGTTGQPHPRSSMSLVNVAYSSVLTWSNPDLTRLESQALVPMFGEHPLELGLKPNADFLLSAASDAKYRRLFPAAFPAEPDPYTFPNITKALASFERTIISARSPYDRYHYNRDDTAVSDSARRGEILFFSQPLSCFRCHGGFTFSGNTSSASRASAEPEFHNTGLYNPYAAPNVGIFEFTGNPHDQGKFKAPTLRNIAVTAPYMHDGSIPTLDAVIDHYAAGGRNGTGNPLKDPLIAGFKLTPADKADLIEFLKSLTDEALLHDPRFSNPWHLNWSSQ